MYCRKCGKKNDDKKTYCIYCGQKLDEEIKKEIDVESSKGEVNYRSIATVSLILSIMIPLAGLILSIVYLVSMKKSEDTLENESAKKIFIISLVISIVWISFPFIIMLFAILKALIS